MYAQGDFEMALVYFHRGNKLRPEVEDFRLGIQKAKEAIDNSIGGNENIMIIIKKENFNFNFKTTKSLTKFKKSFKKKKKLFIYEY